MLTGLSDAAPSRGQLISFDVAPRTRLTSAVLMGTQTTTHWVDGGIRAGSSLAVSQDGTSASVVVPADPVRVPLGWYMLFGMVDDIPSEALLLRVAN
ncbi:MAG: galactose oxidase-like domain-containing protein [Planctomycetota bacterium]